MPLVNGTVGRVVAARPIQLQIRDRNRHFIMQNEQGTALLFKNLIFLGFKHYLYINVMSKRF